MSSRRVDTGGRFLPGCGGGKVAAVLLVVLGLSLMLAGSPAASSGSGDSGASTGAPGATAAPVERFGKLPVRFEQNVGQTDPEVEFLARGSGFTVFLTRTEAVLTLARQGASSGEEDAVGGLGADVVRLSLAGGNQAPEPVGLDRLEGNSNYYGGADPSGWQEGVATYGSVAYRNAYPGIDMVFHGEDGQVKFDFVVAPGADPEVVSVQVDGAALALDGGDLVMSTPSGAQVRKPAPVVYQDVDGARRTVDGFYVVEGEGRFGFDLGSYDRTFPLVIDPAVAYSFNLQGQESYRIAVDDKGNAYVHGETMSVSFPGRGSVPVGEAPDVYVAKLTTDGAGLLYATFLGKAGGEYKHPLRINGLEVDREGRAYVAGETLRDTLPVLGGGTPRVPNPEFDSCTRFCAINEPLLLDGFLVRLAANGQVTYGTYLQNHMRVKDMAVDDQGVYLVGNTQNRSLLTTSNAVQPAPVGELYAPDLDSGWGFVSRVVPGPPAKFYRYLSYFGNMLHIHGAAVDGSGNAHVAGTLNWRETTNNSIPLTGTESIAEAPTTQNGFQTTKSQPKRNDMVVAKINTKENVSQDASLVYSTYLSGSNVSSGVDCPAPGDSTSAACQGAMDIAVHTGMMYVTGFTGSLDFPVRPVASAPPIPDPLQSPSTTVQTPSGPFQPIKNGGWWDAFVAQIDPSKSGDASLVYSTYLGGTDKERGYGIAVASPQAVTVTGWTSSSEAFPVKEPLVGQNTYRGGDSDGFVTTLDLTKPGPQGLVRSTFLGGGGADQGRGVALGQAGDLYLRGSTGSADFPGTTGTFAGGGSGGFVSKIGNPIEETNPCVLTMGRSAGSASSGGGLDVASAGLVGLGVLDGGLGLPAWGVALLKRRRTRRATAQATDRVGSPRRRRGQGGFTLLELLVVVIILGILSAVVVFAVRGVGDKGEKAAIQTDERTIRTALEVHCSQKGTYPEDPDGAGPKDPMDVLVAGKYLSDRSTLHTLTTGDLLTQGLCSGTPMHYRIDGPPTTTPPTTAPGGCP